MDEIPEEDSAYITLDLETGRYGWVIYPFASDVEPFVEEFTIVRGDVTVATAMAAIAVAGFWPSYWGSLFSGTLDVHPLL